MPHLKCVPCRIRVRLPGVATAQTCPECGEPLEPVARLTELVGFRSVDAYPPAILAGGWQAGDRRLAARVLGVTAGRDITDVLAAVDAERWLDDSGSFRPETTAGHPPDKDWR